MNQKVLILSGPTHEYFDPVRFIGNASSGLMGKALAEESIRRGFKVEFVSGPVAEANQPQLGDQGSLYTVVSAEEMLNTAAELFPACDIILFAAAVADYAPCQRETEKKTKSTDDLILHLRPTPDIAATLCMSKRPEQIAIGFALQTADGEIHARRKLQEKKLDGIVLNSPASLGAAGGTFSFLDADSDQFVSWGHIQKTACARKILDEAERRLRLGDTPDTD